MRKQMKRRHGARQKLTACRAGSDGIFALKAARKVVLPRLRHGCAVGGELLAHNLIWIKSLVHHAQSGELATRISKNLAGGNLSEKLLGNGEPLLCALWCTRETGVETIERLHLKDPHALARHLRLLARETLKTRRQKVVAALKLRPPLLIHIGRKPHAEAGTKVVVARNLVVEAQAFRPLSNETQRGAVTNVAR